MIKIHEHLSEINKYIQFTTKNMSNYLQYSENLASHKQFNSIMKEKLTVLLDLGSKINNISKYEFSIFKMTEIGYVLKYFYELYDNKIFEDALMYSFGFNGYIDCIEGIIENIADKKINFATFITKKKKNAIKNNYYAALKNNNPVKNNITLNKNIIITGPNASGKTTILKSVLCNLIFTQQFGCGFYDSATIKPYEHIHCYLNIPDTSGRDSLFQAEARRCKEIIDCLNEETNNNDSHFCIFDELYSGTNPEEAVTSASAFLQYIVNNRNLSCLLTTHYISLCKKLTKNKNIQNLSMKVIKKKRRFSIYLFDTKGNLKNKRRVKGVARYELSQRNFE
jgi:DNA mismatch repair ATPase MutS